MESLTTIKESIPTSIEHLNAGQIQEVYKHVMFDRYKSQMSQKLKEMEFDFSSKMKMWLKNKAHHTARMYSLYLIEYYNALQRRALNVLEVDAFFASDYFENVIKPHGEAKGKAMYAAISSFYSSLVLWGDIPINPFKGVKVSFPVVIKEDYNLITEEEISYIEMSYDKDDESHHKMRMAIHIMKTYGVRVGFFGGDIKFMDNSLYSVNKGKVYSINIAGDEYVLGNLDLLNNIKGVTVQSNFRNMMNRLVKKGILEKKYHPHCLRHFFAVSSYKKDRDIYKLSRRLNHSSTKITETYLAGLEV